MIGVRWWVRLWGVVLFVGLLSLGLLPPHQSEPLDADALLMTMAHRSFAYFLDHQDARTGLVSDGSQWQPASTSATGFCLSALVVGTNNGWISRAVAEDRALRAIETCLRIARSGDSAYEHLGFLYHFMDQDSGKRSQTRRARSEVSIIDHAILLMGALSAGSYFGGRVEEAATELYSLTEWDEFLDPDANQFFGAWTPEAGFSLWHWDAYTDEVFLISILAIGSPTHPVSPEVFYSWSRVGTSVFGREFVRSWSGALFTYQYAHLWLDIRGYVDAQGMDWWANSRSATLANRDLCIKYSSEFASYGEDSWGVTPCFRPQAPQGYEGRFSLMADGGPEPFHDGTVSPAGAAASLCLTPEESTAALVHFYSQIPGVWGRYGFKSSFNLDQQWIAPLYYAIEVGATLLAFDAYKDDCVRSAVARCVFIRSAMQQLGFREAQTPGKVWPE
jgi:hypothetical protein